VRDDRITRPFDDAGTALRGRKIDRMTSTSRPSLVVAALALGIAAAALSGCGSGSVSTTVSTAAKAASGAVSSVSGATTKTPTSTQQTGAPTVTKTSSPPASTTSITSTTSVNVHGTHTTPATSESGGGVPWWGWVLIALGALGVLLAIFAAGRRRGRRTGADSPPAFDEPAAPSGGPAGRPGTTAP
jgi:hypothetical protein